MKIEEGARNVRPLDDGLANFEERALRVVLVEDLRDRECAIVVRAVIEACSKDKLAEERMKATACGVMLQKGRSSSTDRWHYVFRVNGEQEYALDRWD